MSRLSVRKQGELENQDPPRAVMIALPLSSELAAAIVRCDWVEPHVMAAYVIDWQRRERERKVRLQ